MVLIKCPECGKKVSDQAGSCPDCGFPLENYVEKLHEKKEEKSKNDSKTMWRIAKYGAIFLLMIILITIGVSSGSYFVMFLFSVLTGLCAFLFPREGYEGFMEALRNYKKHKIRTGIGILRAIIILSMGISSIDEGKEAARIAAIPVPVISAVGEYSGVEFSTGFEVKVMVNDAEKVLVGGKELMPIDGSGYNYMTTVSLDEVSTEVNFIAMNGPKQSNKNIVVTRKMNEEEQRLYDEQQRIAAEEKARVEAERLAKEAEAKKEADRRNKEIARLESKYEKIASNGYLYEIEKKLHNLGFKQIKSGFEEAPDGSTNVATYYQGEDSGFTVEIRLQSSFALGKHYYRVMVH